MKHAQTDFEKSVWATYLFIAKKNPCAIYPYEVETVISSIRTIPFGFSAFSFLSGRNGYRSRESRRCGLRRDDAHRDDRI